MSGAGMPIRPRLHHTGSIATSLVSASSKVFFSSSSTMQNLNSGSTGSPEIFRPLPGRTLELLPTDLMLATCWTPGLAPVPPVPCVPWLYILPLRPDAPNCDADDTLVRVVLDRRTKPVPRVFRSSAWLISITNDAGGGGIACLELKVIVAEHCLVVPSMRIVTTKLFLLTSSAGDPSIMPVFVLSFMPFGSAGSTEKTCNPSWITFGYSACNRTKSPQVTLQQPWRAFTPFGSSTV
mmetsp:Transcript_17455/g.40466  ORF Transcript_17455/g.40466 Transcript_17455/m.40466 type:complete len:237 (+) Transcript_17455:724-1434(+)